jgi:hypothetical protein
VLCVLQEAGESRLVLATGEQLLQDQPPKRFKQDVVLATALSYVDLSRDAMAASSPDVIRCCEVLERALKLLQVRGLDSHLFVTLNETFAQSGIKIVFFCPISYIL